MFLTIDIGNTNIVVALFNEDTLVSSWRLHTDVSRTGDEYGILISSFFTDGGFSVADIESCIISSVVPNLIGPFVGLIVKKTGKKPFIISPGIFSQLPITIPESATHEIGSDLVCNAVEAYCRYKGACIVVEGSLNDKAGECLHAIAGVHGEVVIDSESVEQGSDCLPLGGIAVRISGTEDVCENLVEVWRGEAHRNLLGDDHCGPRGDDDLLVGSTVNSVDGSRIDGDDSLGVSAECHTNDGGINGLFGIESDNGTS